MDNYYLNNNTFFLFTLALFIFLHHNARTNRVTVSLVSPVSPTRWNEIVMAIHSVMGVVLTTILVFLPLKKEADASGKIPMPLVSNPTENLKTIAYDLAMLVITLGWGGFFILALPSRGYYMGKVMDCLSIAFGLVLLGFLLYYVIGGPGTIGAVFGCLAIAAGHFYVRNW
ncbi:unnamed protein product [Microthlaspi erraticum]|uniref:Uncharacterized protein n=1 Tax=Microthlaspi erraticum TaxID=1685480 RepID=A0A6D2HI20_9BRAS|nr:unnamed protein product [Microthlaspi erraticum]CAA7029041.1 unnamed protein product [Microthlaspi erraticum]